MSLYLRSELEAQHGKRIPLKNALGDIIGYSTLTFEDGELKSEGYDRLTGIGFKATAIPREYVIDEKDEIL